MEKGLDSSVQFETTLKGRLSSRILNETGAPGLSLVSPASLTPFQEVILGARNLLPGTFNLRACFPGILTQDRQGNDRWRRVQSHELDNLMYSSLAVVVVQSPSHV